MSPICRFVDGPREGDVEQREGAPWRITFPQLVGPSVVHYDPENPPEAEEVEIREVVYQRGRRAPDGTIEYRTVSNES